MHGMAEVALFTWREITKAALSDRSPWKEKHSCSIHVNCSNHVYSMINLLLLWVGWAFCYPWPLTLKLLLNIFIIKQNAEENPRTFNSDYNYCKQSILSLSKDWNTCLTNFYWNCSSVLILMAWPDIRAFVQSFEDTALYVHYFDYRFRCESLKSMIRRWIFKWKCPAFAKKP